MSFTIAFLEAKPQGFGIITPREGFSAPPDVILLPTILILMQNWLLMLTELVEELGVPSVALPESAIHAAYALSVFQ